MKAEELIGAIEKFFLDLIGTVLPGLLIESIFIVLFGRPDGLTVLWALRPSEESGWVVWLVGGFMTGHAVASLGENIMVPLCDMSLGQVAAKLRILQRFKPDHHLISELRAGSLFEMVIRHYNAKLGTILSTDETRSFLFVRNLAMGVLGEERFTVHRFMFLALLNLGIATTLCVFGVLAILLDLLGYKDFLAPAFALPLWVIGVLAMFLAVPFLERRYRFYGITMSVPFSMAAGRLAAIVEKKPAERTAAFE